MEWITTFSVLFGIIAAVIGVWAMKGPEKEAKAPPADPSPTSMLITRGEGGSSQRVAILLILSGLFLFGLLAYHFVQRGGLA